MAVFPQLDALALDELIAFYSSDPPAAIVADGETDLWFQELAAKIAGFGWEGFQRLRELSPSGDNSRSCAVLIAIRFLTRPMFEKHRRELEAICESFLDHNNPTVIAASIDTLKCLSAAHLLRRVLSYLEHQSPYVVGSALRFLSKHATQTATPILIQSLHSPHAIVRQNAIDELDDLECTDAVPHIRSLLNDPVQAVREAAATAISHLAGS